MPPRMTAGRERSPHRSGVPRRHRLWPRGPVDGAGPVGDQSPQGHVQDGGSRPGEGTVFLRQDDPAEGAERGAMACTSASSRRRPCSASWNDAQAPANRSRKEGSVRDHRRTVAVELPAARQAARRVPPRAKARVNRDCRRARFFQRAAGALVIGVRVSLCLTYHLYVMQRYAMLGGVTRGGCQGSGHRPGRVHTSCDAKACQRRGGAKVPGGQRLRFLGCASE